MQNREKYLAAGLGLAAVFWLFGGMVDAWLFGPFRTRSERVAALSEKVEGLQDQALEIARSRKLMTDWKKISLPPDRGAATAKRPDALDAQRLYQAWLTDLVHLAGFDQPSVKPASQRRLGSFGRGRSAKTVYVGVAVTIEMEGRFSQLCSFLDHFYRADLLQRINKLNIDSRESLGDPVLKISLEAEGLALVDVPWRPTLYPETELTADLTDSDTSCSIAEPKNFPAKPPFRVRIGNEFAIVTATDGKTWTLQRGVDRTFAARHTTAAVVELAPTRADVPSRSTEEFREILAANVFIKPPPPKEYRLKLGPIATLTVTRGEPLSYSIPVTDYDPTLGKPEFVLRSEALPDVEFDRGLGKLTWNPSKDQAIGTFPVEVEVRHPSAADGIESAKFAIVLREPNALPTVAPPTSQTVYLGRTWTYPLNFQDLETAADKLQLKLDSPPEGVTINEATRSLEWTPPPTIPLGEQTIKVVATDDGNPPQSVTLTLPIKVEEDAARFTYLVGSVAVDGDWQAWLYNRAQDQRTVLRRGDEVKVSDISGTVTEIGKDYVEWRNGETVQRLDLGKNLREIETTTTAAADPAPSKS